MKQLFGYSLPSYANNFKNTYILLKLFFCSAALLLLTFALSMFTYSFFDGSFPIHTDSLTFSSIVNKCDQLWDASRGRYSTDFSGNFWTFNVSLPACIQSIAPIAYFNSIILFAGIYTVLFLGYIRNEIRKNSILLVLIICVNPFVWGRYFEYSRELVMIMMLLIYSILFNSTSSFAKVLKYFSLIVAVTMRPATLPIITLSHFNLIWIQDSFSMNRKTNSSAKSDKFKYSRLFLIFECSLLNAVVLNRQNFLQNIPLMQSKTQNNQLFSDIGHLNVLKYNMFGSFGELVNANNFYSLSTHNQYYIICAIWLSLLIICLTIRARFRYIIFICFAGLILTVSYPTPHARYMIPFNMMAVSFVYPKSNSNKSDIMIEPNLCDESE